MCGKPGIEPSKEVGKDAPQHQEGGQDHRARGHRRNRPHASATVAERVPAGVCSTEPGTRSQQSKNRNTVSKTTVLATGRITGAEIITITQVEWSDSSPVVMIRWPGQPSLTDPNRLPAVASEVMAIMTAANAKLDAIQRQQPHLGRKNHGAGLHQGSFLGSQSLRAGQDAAQERHPQGPRHQGSSGQEQPCIDPGFTVNPGSEAMIGSAASG